MRTYWSYHIETYKCAAGKFTLVGFTFVKQYTAGQTAPGWGQTHRFTFFQPKRTREAARMQREAARSKEKQLETVYIMNEDGLA